MKKLMVLAVGILVGVSLPAIERVEAKNNNKDSDRGDDRKVDPGAVSAYLDHCKKIAGDDIEKMKACQKNFKAKSDECTQHGSAMACMAMEMALASLDTVVRDKSREVVTQQQAALAQQRQELATEMQTGQIGINGANQSLIKAIGASQAAVSGTKNALKWKTTVSAGIALGGLQSAQSAKAAQNSPQLLAYCGTNPTACSSIKQQIASAQERSMKIAFTGLQSAAAAKEAVKAANLEEDNYKTFARAIEAANNGNMPTAGTTFSSLKTGNSGGTNIGLSSGVRSGAKGKISDPVAAVKTPDGKVQNTALNQPVALPTGENAMGGEAPNPWEGGGTLDGGSIGAAGGGEAAGAGAGMGEGEGTEEETAAVEPGVVSMASKTGGAEGDVAPDPAGFMAAFEDFLKPAEDPNAANADLSGEDRDPASILDMGQPGEANEELRVHGKAVNIFEVVTSRYIKKVKDGAVLPTFAEVTPGPGAKRK